MKIIFILLTITSFVISQTSPVFHWKFEEGVGTITYDEIINHQAQVNNCNWSTNNFGNSITSLGYDSFISAEYDSKMDLKSEGTLAIWFNINQYKAYSGLIHKGEKKSFVDESYTLQFDKTGKKLLAALFTESDDATVTSSKVLETNLWYWAVLVWDNSRLKLFINGELDFDVEKPVGTLKTTNGKLQIGSQLVEKYNSSFKYFGFDGSIDEVMIYDLALSDGEISNLYNLYTNQQNNPKVLVANWGLNEGNGFVITDSVNNLSGNITGCSWESGVIENALSFDGDNDFVTIADDDLLDIQEELTLELWVKWTIEPSSEDSWLSLISKDGENSYQLQHGMDNKSFEFAVKTETGRSWLRSTTQPEKDVWYYVVGTYNSSTEEMAIFVNGVREAVKNKSGLINVNDKDLLIGANEKYPTRLFKGLVDEVKIHSRALSEDEILTNFLAIEILTPSIEKYVKFNLDENEGEVIFDEKGEYKGNLIDSPEWTEGKINNALNFNGASQYIQFSNTSNFPLENELTLSAWVKAFENKTAKIVQKGDWDGHSLGMDKWNGWKATVSVNNEAHSLEWNYGRPILGEWYLLTVTYNGDSIKFFVNNELQGTKEVSGTLRQNTRDLCIASDAGNQKFFNGSIDEVIIANNAISDENIMNLYNYEVPEQTVWEQIETTGYDSFIYSFDINSDGEIFSGNWGGAGIYKSSDNGVTWQNLISGYWIWSIKIDADGNIFAGTSEAGIIKSTDNGNTWETLNLGVAVKDIRDISIKNNGTIYASSWGGGVLKSEDNGETWSNITNNLPSNVIHAIDFDSQGNIWVGAYDGFGIFMSENEGETWQSIPIPYGYIWSLDISNNDIIYAGTYGSEINEELGLYISTDLGVNWEAVEEFKGINIYGTQFVNQNAYVLTWENGIYSSSTQNNLENIPDWLPFNNGMMSGGVAAILTLPNGNLLLSTDDSKLYLSDLTLTNIVSPINSNIIPAETKLMQNYPNPFNPITIINFEIKNSGNYRIEVFNLIGEQIGVLIDNNFSPGNYSVKFDGSNLTSGIYFYQLMGESINITKKMILTK